MLVCCSGAVRTEWLCILSADRLFYLTALDAATTNAVAALFYPSADRLRERFALAAVVAQHVDELVNPPYAARRVRARAHPLDLWSTPRCV